MSKNDQKTEPRITFVCSECGQRDVFIHEIRSHAVSRMVSAGWRIREGQSECGACVSAELSRDLAASVAVLAARKVAQSNGAAR